MHSLSHHLLSATGKLVCPIYVLSCFQAGTGIAELIALETSKQVNSYLFIFAVAKLFSLVSFKIEIADFLLLIS